mmetsp:Transcript_43324/g.134779  ORF Transcript_43324/g.134779 Transcript_43324/m.134779 type:complete len:299 (-) Transcript_43324:194-1090(-)
MELRQQLRHAQGRRARADELPEGVRHLLGLQLQDGRQEVQEVLPLEEVGDGHQEPRVLRHAVEARHGLPVRRSEAILALRRLHEDVEHLEDQSLRLGGRPLHDDQELLLRGGDVLDGLLDGVDEVLLHLRVALREGLHELVQEDRPLDAEREVEPDSVLRNAQDALEEVRAKLLHAQGDVDREGKLGGARSHRPQHQRSNVLDAPAPQPLQRQELVVRELPTGGRVLRLAARHQRRGLRVREVRQLPAHGRLRARSVDLVDNQPDGVKAHAAVLATGVSQLEQEVQALPPACGLALHE